MGPAAKRFGGRGFAVLAVLALLALAGPIAGCGGSSPAQSRPVAFSTAGWESLAGDVSLAALRGDPPRIGGCSLAAERKAPRALRLDGCAGGRGGVIARGGPPRSASCSREPERTRCSARNGVSVTVWAPRTRSAVELLKATIEGVDETMPDDYTTWGLWLEPGLNESKGSLALASPRHADEARARPCAVGKDAALVLGSLEVSRRTARHVAGRGVHILMIEKPSAVSGFSMAIDGECRRSRRGVMRGAAIEPPPSRVQPFVLIIPNYYSSDRWRDRRALVRGLLLEPKLYRGEKHNQLPGTMLSRPEDPEAAPGQIPLSMLVWADG